MNASPLDRLPPQNLDAERGTIGSLWLNPALCDDVALVVRPEDFYSDANAKLYRRTMEIHNDGTRVDTTLLHERLKQSGELEFVGGLPYLLEVSDSVPHAANAVQYAKIVRDKATLRGVVHSATEMLREAYDDTADADAVLSKAEQKLFQVRDVRGSDSVAHIQDVLIEALSGLEDDGFSLRKGISSGFGKLDGMTNGMRTGQLTILAGRPGNGKSAIAGNIAEHVALDGKSVLFVSLEMSKNELAERMLCSQAGVNSFKLRKGFITASDRERLMQAYGRLAKTQIQIDDCAYRTMPEIASVARRMKRKVGLDLIVIDYLQLVTPENRRAPRQEQVAEMSRRLKNMTKELEVPILCLAQLNRGVDGKGEPELHHLRESGAIEQDADNVMFVWRTGEDGTEGWLKVAKQRNGPVGKYQLVYQPEYVRFKELASAAVEKAAQQYEEYGLTDEF